MHRYEVVKANSHEEAIAKSQFFMGQKAAVSEIQASANASGTYSVWAEFTLQERKPDAEDRRRDS